MRKHWRGTVLVEFAMAAVGLIAIAFVVARVGFWLNSSMQQRNDAFQDSRVDAANIAPGAGPERFDAPNGLHLIGPTAQSTGGVGQQPDSSYDTTCASGLQATLFEKQQRLFELWGREVPDAQVDAEAMNSNGKLLVRQANVLARDAARIYEIYQDIITRINPRLETIHNLPIVQASEIDMTITLPPLSYVETPVFDFGSIDCSVDPDPTVHTGLHNIDEREQAIRCQLGSRKEGSVAWWRAAYYARIAEIDAQLSLGTCTAETLLGGTATVFCQLAATYAAYLGELAACQTQGYPLAPNPDSADGLWSVESHYGPRVHPINGSWSVHTGVDLGATCGTPVLAFADGIVQWRSGSGYGYYIELLHVDADGNFTGDSTLYAHLQSTASEVPNGQGVSAGDQIALSGGAEGMPGAGTSTGCHLHFEYRENGVPIDPEPLLAQAVEGEPLECDDAEIARLDGELTRLGDEITRLENERQEIQDVVLPPLNDLYNQLRNELSVVRDLASEVRGLQGYGYAAPGEAWQPGKSRLLNEIDQMLRDWNDGDTWMSLWRELVDKYGLPLSDTLAPNFRWIYECERQWRDNTDDPAYDEATLPEIAIGDRAADGAGDFGAFQPVCEGLAGHEPGDLEELIRRVWWMAQERLDFAQSMQTEFNDPLTTGPTQTVHDYFGEYGWYDEAGTLHTSDPPFEIPEAVEGCTTGADGIITCTEPVEYRARYLEFDRLMQLLQGHGGEIRELVIDIQGLEYSVQNQCASQEESN